MKKNILATLAIAILLISLALFTSCGEKTTTATLVTAFVPSDTQTKTECEIEGEVTPEKLAEKLSELTGLDFFITSSTGDEVTLIIDWAANSTLIANLDDREQKEEYFFFESDGMRWFMMDSMWYTLLENFGDMDIYYTMDGGKELIIEDLNPEIHFGLLEVPYPGGTFLYEHAQESAG